MKTSTEVDLIPALMRSSTSSVQMNLVNQKYAQRYWVTWQTSSPLQRRLNVYLQTLDIYMMAFSIERLAVPALIS